LNQLSKFGQILAQKTQNLALKPKFDNFFTRKLKNLEPNIKIWTNFGPKNQKIDL